MRRGIADLHRRAQVSQNVNGRLLDALASVEDSRTLEELTAAIQQPVRWKGRRVRALRLWADELALLMAVNHGEFRINGFRMLRAHGLIRKVPRTHRYEVTQTGRSVLAAVLIVSRTSLKQLGQLLEKAA